MRTLKSLIRDLEEILNQNNGRLNTHVFLDMTFKLDQLKQKVDEADAVQRRHLALEALELIAALLSITTNVVMLLK